MKKYLKIISIPFMTILFVFVGIMTVNAAYGGTFTVKLKALGLGGDKATDWVNPPANYAYVSDVTIQTVNGDKYDVFYQTSYNSSDVTVGGKLTLRGKGNKDTAVWFPLRGNAYGGPYTPYASKQCSGQNTDSNYCALANNDYRLVFQNNSLSGGEITITSLFTFD